MYYTNHSIYRVNSVSVCGRTLVQVKKKWQDVQSMAKKKEVARLQKHRKMGGGPYAGDLKEWEKVVNQRIFLKFKTPV